MTEKKAFRFWLNVPDPKQLRIFKGEHRKHKRQKRRWTNRLPCDNFCGESNGGGELKRAAPCCFTEGGLTAHLDVPTEKSVQRKKCIQKKSSHRKRQVLPFCFTGVGSVQRQWSVIIALHSSEHAQRTAQCTASCSKCECTSLLFHSWVLLLSASAWCTAKHHCTASCRYTV